jgi:hypothetical protein
VHFSTAETATLCANSSRKYGNCFAGELLGPDGNGTGWLFQNGGFPPLVFGYDPVSQWFYVEAQSDDREFKLTHTVADCHLHWPGNAPTLSSSTRARFFRADVVAARGLVQTRLSLFSLRWCPT